MVRGSTPHDYLLEDTILLTAWNPNGQPQTLPENENANETLRRAVADAGGTVIETVTTTASNRSWLEDTFVIGSLASDDARRLARDFERYAATVVAFVRLAMIRIMLRRLAANASS